MNSSEVIRVSLVRKKSFPATAQAASLDFRKEYKGSVLERKFQMRSDRMSSSIFSSTIKSIAEWFVARKNPSVSHRTNSLMESLPSEMLLHVMQNLDRKSLLNCRHVDCRWNRLADCVMDQQQMMTPIVISRFVVTGNRKGVELRWIAYESQKTASICVPYSIIKRKVELSFNFQRFTIQRLILKDLPLTDELVDFLRMNLSFSDLSYLTQLSLNKVDMNSANSLTLHRLLAPVAKGVELLEIVQCYGMRPDSVTDCHLAQMDASRLRRVTVDGVKFASSRRGQSLRVGDESLRHLVANGNFPILILDRCSVTTKSVCDYTQDWFNHLAESERGIRSQVCTVKRSLGVKGAEFEAECRRRGLHCRNRRGSDSMTLYKVQENQQEFTVALATSPPEKYEDIKIEPRK